MADSEEGPTPAIIAIRGSTPALAQASWTHKDYLLFVMFTLVTCGDAIELYLPGVMTQAASCELGLTSEQESWLGVVLYYCVALSILVTGTISDR